MASSVQTTGPNGSLVIQQIDNLTNTAVALAVPSGAKWCLMSYELHNGASAVANQFAKVVVNPASAADAAGKLAQTTGGHMRLFQGRSRYFDCAGVTWVYVQAAQAIGGAELTSLEFCFGV